MHVTTNAEKEIPVRSRNAAGTKRQIHERVTQNDIVTHSKVSCCVD